MPFQIIIEMNKALEKFVNLFHRKQRFAPEYQNLSFLKKVLFVGAAGFFVLLSASKFFYSDLIFSFEPNQTNKLYVRLNPSLQKGVYQPSMHLVFGIFQRIYARLREEEPYLKLEEEHLEGEVLNWVLLHDKSYHLSRQKQKDLPLVIVLAGSQGVDNTIKSLLLASYNLGYRVVALNPSDLYDTQKLDKIVSIVKGRYPNSQFFGIGVEYGANLLLNYAAKKNEVFRGLVSLGNPYDLVKSEINLQESWIWKELHNCIVEGKKQKALKINKNKQIQSNSLFQLQKQIYNIQDEQYIPWKQQNSSINNIKDLKVPTLLLQSRQDPFTQDIEGDQRFQNEHCIYVTTQRGGHNQWFQNLWMNRWFNTPIRGFLKLLHSKKVDDVVNRNPQGTTPTLL